MFVKLYYWKYSNDQGPQILSLRVVFDPRTACWPNLILAVPHKRNPERLKSPSKALVWMDYSARRHTNILLFWNIRLYAKLDSVLQKAQISAGRSGQHKSIHNACDSTNSVWSFISIILHNSWMFPKCCKRLNFSYYLPWKPRGGVETYFYSSFNLAYRWGGWLTPRTGRFAPFKKYTLPTVQQAGWIPGPLWTVAETLATTGIWPPDRPSRNVVAISTTLHRPNKMF